MGRNDFEGAKTQRVYSLAGKGAPFLALAEHPCVVALLDRLLLQELPALDPPVDSARIPARRLRPGTPTTRFISSRGRARCPRGVGHLGDRRLHRRQRRDGDHPAEPHLGRGSTPTIARTPSVRAMMPAGSAIVFDGALWHRGGATLEQGTRLAVSPQYCQPFLRPQESQLLIVPPERARGVTDGCASMLGYSIHPPFVGQVDGMHPLRLVDETYRAKKGDDHAIADRVLSRPESVFDKS